MLMADLAESGMAAFDNPQTKAAIGALHPAGGFRPWLCQR
jgi:hypothetical protein